MSSFVDRRWPLLRRVLAAVRDSKDALTYLEDSLARHDDVPNGDRRRAGADDWAHSARTIVGRLRECIQPASELTERNTDDDHRSEGSPR
jgi:hypothetical protein